MEKNSSSSLKNELSQTSMWRQGCFLGYCMMEVNVFEENKITVGKLRRRDRVDLDWVMEMF